MTDIARQTVEFLYDDSGSLPVGMLIMCKSLDQRNLLNEAN